jgi:hypothetical protein
MAALVFALLRLRLRLAPAGALAAGLLLGGVVMTTARLMLIVAAVVAWVLIGGGPTTRIRLRHAFLVALPAVLFLAAWLARNASVVGTPVITTEAGESLWVANNRWTMSYFPAQSIDLSVGASYAGMTDDERDAFARVSSDEAARDALLRRWAIAYIAGHPGQTLMNAVRKVAVVVGAVLSPERGSAVQIGYALWFLPIHLLAVAAFVRHRTNWRVHALVGLIVAGFLATTAVFWAHTSHKSFLDALAFVYAPAAFRLRPAEDA